MSARSGTLSYKSNVPIIEMNSFQTSRFKMLIDLTSGLQNCLKSELLLLDCSGGELFAHEAVETGKFCK